MLRTALTVSSLIFFLLAACAGQEGAKPSPENVPMESRKDIPVSDREKAGLRGPVKTCTEETTVKDSDGTEGKFSDTTEYDASGRIIATHGSNPERQGMEQYPGI